jgi:hypothetical protein
MFWGKELFHVSRFERQKVTKQKGAPLGSTQPICIILHAHCSLSPPPSVGPSSLKQKKDPDGFNLLRIVICTMQVITVFCDQQQLLAMLICN